MSEASHTSQSIESQSDRINPTSFSTSAIVLVTLNNPREKYWGGLIAIKPAGISLRGVELNSFEDFVRLVKAGDDVVPNAVFFPMHRVERVEMDSRNGDIPSIQERFHSKSGRDFSAFL